MAIKELLQSVNFGESVAEQEANSLASYFVQTDQWRRILAGEIDIVYGPKGSGKSAIYSQLINPHLKLADSAVVVIAAENPRGATVFRDISEDPPTGETEFVALWKLYFLSLIGDLLQERNITNPAATAVRNTLHGSGLLERGVGIGSRLKKAAQIAKQLTRIDSIGGKVGSFDPSTGMPVGMELKITLREPEQAEQRAGKVSLDQLIELANAALVAVGTKIWVAIDRLDVAFDSNPDLEANALRALFRVYQDLVPFSDRISLKIFLRTDIWARITQQGFREASHITRHTTIDWTPNLLMNLVIRRAINNNPGIRDYYGAVPGPILRDFDKQQDFFYKLFPPQVDIGLKKPKTFDWMLTRTADGTRKNAPRELIQLLNAVRDAQIKKFEIGKPEIEDPNLFSRSAIKDGLPTISAVRLQQTLYAEHPEHKEYIEQLKGGKSEQTPDSLASLWGITPEEATGVADKLANIGFFEQRGTKEEPTFWVPFIYRDGLALVQGSTEE